MEGGLAGRGHGDVERAVREAETEIRGLHNEQDRFMLHYDESLHIEVQLSHTSQLQTPSDQLRDQSLRQRQATLDTLLRQQVQTIVQLRMTVVERLQTCTMLLNQMLSCLLEDKLPQWQRKQQLAAIGGPPEGSLDALQEWSECMADAVIRSRQHLKRFESLLQQLALPGPSPDALLNLNNNLARLLSDIATKTLVMERQPPQVLKTQTKFGCSLRFLAGSKLELTGSLPHVHATIVSEAQARALHVGHHPRNEVSGEIHNNNTVMEYQQGSGALMANFRSMLLKKIRRSDRRGSESVTEEKFAILFQATLNTGDGEFLLHAQVLSLPVVVIVHGSQENNATATVLWDNAFSEPRRLPFQVPEAVPWSRLMAVLDSKFRSEVDSPTGLCTDSVTFLAHKAFGYSSGGEDLADRAISWAQFNRENLPGRTFTFWQWFDGVMELTKKYLKSHWNDGAIVGFVSRAQAQDMLLSLPVGTFLLRFSDSEIGGVTIAWGAQMPGQPGERIVWNVKPFTARELAMLPLADRVRDLDSLQLLYPARPKDHAFAKYYSPPPGNNLNGYIVLGIRQVLPGFSMLPPGLPGTPCTSYASSDDTAVAATAGTSATGSPGSTARALFTGLGHN
ncbi:signal transducer and activator of transcription 5A-like [Petromyzon marinus]|uniref:signal transducer and activator of transcription 5A-like n=1 Tax=Petromyzon marinus TaxID=7757 RepID=UPI003F6FF190